VKSWGVQRWRGKSAAVRPAEPLVDFDKVTMFLEGQLLEAFRENREAAPDWVWVSVLAHASEDLLSRCAAERGAPSPSSSRCVWDRTLSLLAQVLLDHAARMGEAVAVLQHDIVVPIELRLGARPLAPPTLVRLVLSGLEDRVHAASDDQSSTAERQA
jgi:hypothetical protein